MDLNDFIPQTDEIRVELKHKDKPLLNEDGTPMVINLWAPHTKEYKEVIYSNIDESLKKADSKKDYRPTAKEASDRRLETLAKLTKSWDITYKGEKPKLTVKVAKELYDTLLFLRIQLDKALEETEDFI